MLNYSAYYPHITWLHAGSAYDEGTHNSFANLVSEIPRRYAVRRYFMAEIPFTEPADFQAVLINDLLGYHGDSAFLQRSCSRMWNVKITATYSGLSSDMRRARYLSLIHI